MLRTRKMLWAPALAAALAAAPAGAQFTQYIRPGSLSELAVSSKQQLEENMAAARWRLGPVRLAPRLYLSDVSYQSNLFGQPEGQAPVEDWRATLGGGLTAYLPVGPKVIAAAFGLPEYNYWLDQEELRTVTGRYGVGVFGFFNRLTVELEGTRLESERQLNLETDAPVEIVTQGGRLQLELEATPRLTLFGSLSDAAVTHDGEAVERALGLRPRSLDRDETAARAGVRYNRSGRWSIGVGVEETETEFRDPGDPRSNSGTSPFVNLTASGNRLTGSIDLVARDLDFDAPAPAGRAGYDSLTGQAQLGATFGTRTTLTGYGVRNLVYSAIDGRSLFTETRWGAAAGVELREEVRLAAFVELGSARYEPSSPVAANRDDDLEAYGTTLAIDLRRRAVGSGSYDLQLTFGYSETRIDSNQPGFDRTSRTFASGVALQFGTSLLPW